MYRFLDRPVVGLDPTHRFLLAAARLWAATGHASALVAQTFAQADAIETLGDFAMAMTTIAQDSGWILRLGALDDPRVGDGDARFLALFDAALAGRPADVRRRAAALVEEEAVPRLALAAELVALRLTDGVFVERGR